ncbi:MAG TPA: hypothetical protein ENI20_07985, partial [Bacteroides sp.]|nr:hypothetical protein [Bacteroides sp.]
MAVEDNAFAYIKHHIINIKAEPFTQLRGRAGRQGDPGSSQFYASLEDNLMRLFGSDRISGVMDRLGLKEGEV